MLSAIAEGIERFPDYRGLYSYWQYRDYSDGSTTKSPIYSYKTLWESINGVGSWELNPWVWVVKFEKL